jgi:hypothetical protein
MATQRLTMRQTGKSFGRNGSSVEVIGRSPIASASALGSVGMTALRARAPPG